MVRVLLLASALLFCAQDDGRFCPKMNRCTKEKGKKRRNCPDCNKRRIRESEAYCSGCAGRIRFCKLCGRPKEGDEDGLGVGAAARSVNEDRIRKMLAVIAGDDIEGRQAGYPGAEKASAWIADRLKEWGLKPAFGESYFQEFKLKKKRSTRNVGGILEGTELKDEVVIIGGHYDHLGMQGQSGPGRFGGGKPDDEVWNGADDNGSGISTLLEMARVLASRGLRFKRSILFLWFSGEELGFLGAKHYCDHPAFPLDKTSGMICMDMIGRNKEKPMVIKGCGSSPAWSEFAKPAIELSKLKAKIEPRATGLTDYHAFLDKEVPAIDFFAGKHADYHRKSDHPDKVAVDRCAQVARAALRIAAAVADREARLVFTKPARR